MATSKQLLDYFTQGLAPCRNRVGAEIETLFVSSKRAVGPLVTLEESQRLFQRLAKDGWTPSRTPDGMHIVQVANEHGFARKGAVCKYDAGHANIEVAVPPTHIRNLDNSWFYALNDLYACAAAVGLSPHHGPIVCSAVDTLIDFTPRDRAWLALDGRTAFAPIARIASVQFTFDVSVDRAVECLNRLGENIDFFRAYFPQDEVWKRYVAKSLAGYKPDRYGGPLRFTSLEDYCAKLAEHEVVLIDQQKLVPFQTVDDLDISMFIRSVWWYFRLRRYGKQLCIEVRPIGRYSDDVIAEWLRIVADIIGHPRNRKRPRRAEEPAYP